MHQTKLFVTIFLWIFLTVCQPVQAKEIVLQPGTVEGKDIWTTSVFSYAPGGGGPGGGLDNEWLQVGGWGDLYHTLIEFDLTGFPAVALSAKIELFVGQSKGSGSTGMYLDRITEFWDWRIQGTGSDLERLWWADRPSATQWIPGSLPDPSVGQWYSIDITDLYNAWQDGTYPNYGIQLRPVSSNNRWDEFYSSNYMDDPSLRPKLVVEVPEAPDSSFDLSFPLPNRNPSSAVINSVFDHSMSSPFCPDGVVVAYTGEEGRSEYGQSTWFFPAKCGDLHGFKNSTGSNFSIKENYSGAGEPNYLFYDGHPGYDYRTTDQSPDGRINVLAAAAGVAYIIPDSLFNTIYIDHENGYKTYYLHLNQRNVKDGQPVTRGQVIGISGDTGSPGAPHLHFEVKKNVNGTDVLVDPYGWAGDGDDPYITKNIDLWAPYPDIGSNGLGDSMGPKLVFPENGATGLGPDIIFRWNASTNLDGDAAAYTLIVCEDVDLTIGCITNDVLATVNKKGINYAGLGLGLGMVFGLVLIGSKKNRRRVGLFIATIIVSGSLLVSCSSDVGDITPSSDSGNPSADMTKTVFGLEPGKIHHWKVTADDGNGGSTDSEVRNFSTR